MIDEADLLRRWKEWVAWRNWTGPWYLRWRRMLWWKRPKSEPLNFDELIHASILVNRERMLEMIARPLFWSEAEKKVSVLRGDWATNGYMGTVGKNTFNEYLTATEAMEKEAGIHTYDDPNPTVFEFQKGPEE